MQFETIQYESNKGTATITLNRPESLNSFTTQMHEEVRAALDAVEADSDVRALLLTGAGRGFCAGQDLSDRQVNAGDAPVDLGATLNEYYNPLIRRIRALDRPVVCAVNGVAAGAGANIALACDIVLAARSAKFIQAFCKIGAKALSLLGTPVTADEAAAIGMIYRAVDDDDLLSEARSLCGHFATQPTLGLAAIKEALQLSWSNDLDSQLALERDNQRRLGQTEDYREGVAAFLAKREPVYRGR